MSNCNFRAKNTGKKNNSRSIRNFLRTKEYKLPDKRTREMQSKVDAYRLITHLTSL